MGDLTIRDKRYEIRNSYEAAFASGCGNVECYFDNYELLALDEESAITECNLLQDKHDAEHRELFGEDNDYHHAPNYIASLYEIDHQGNARKIEV